MPTGNDTELLTFAGWVFRLRRSEARPGRLMLLLHGWKGSEDSMWVFSRDLPRSYTLLAPRAPYADAEGGYTWREMTGSAWGFPTLGDLQPAAQALLGAVDAWAASAGVEAAGFDLMGFSQGAAMVYTLALLHPERVHALAALSGFLPAGAETHLTSRPLEGKAVFVAHGRQDDLVPVERARRAVRLLSDTGGRVTYCESEAGHKVSKDCFGAIASFFEHARA